MSEAQAIEKGYDIKVGRFSMAANSKALILGERNGLVKIVAEAGSGEGTGDSYLRGSCYRVGFRSGCMHCKAHHRG